MMMMMSIIIVALLLVVLISTTTTTATATSATYIAETTTTTTTTTSTTKNKQTIQNSNTIDRIYYINLPNNKKRREFIDSWLGKSLKDNVRGVTPDSMFNHTTFERFEAQIGQAGSCVGG